MSNRPSAAEIDAALRTLARALAPHLAPAVKELLDAGENLRETIEPRSQDELEAEIRRLPPDVLEGGLLLFQALGANGEIDSITLADRAGRSTREVSGKIIQPLQRALADLGFANTPWSATRAAPSGGVGARTVWRTTNDQAVDLLKEAFTSASAEGERGPQPAAASSADRERRVLPSAVFLYSPAYASDLVKPQAGWSSCLRTSEPGSRALIYRAQSAQALVAVFDVESWPEPDRDWGYVADGYFTPLPKEIPREKLLADEDLEPVFRHIQGRRRLPPNAQEALVALIKRETGEPIPQQRPARRR